MSFWVWSGFGHVGAGAVNVYTLAADPGSYTVTGTAATLSTTRLLVADAGSVAITGTDAALVVGRMVVADAGSVAVTGTDAALLATRLLVADAGAVNIVGTAATLAVGRTLVADAGSVVVTGAAADLIYAQGATLTADPGSYAITGTAADLVRGFVLAADAGAIVVTGTAATFLRGYTFSAEAGTVTITGADAALLYTANPTTFATASLIIPRLIQPRRWHTNGRPPDVRYLRDVIRAQNHTVAYRRKTFFSWGDLDAPHAASASELKLFRFRCHTGHGATHLGFLLGLGRTDVGNAATATPYVNVGVTPAGGSVTNVRVYGGQTNGTVTDAPSTILWRQVQVPVSGATTYEVIISAVERARVLSACAYEIAGREVDPSVDWYVAEQPGVEAPVFDGTRERILRGMSEMWRRNGTHLYTWPGAGTGVNPTFGASWTNVIDDGTGGANSATPGVYLLGDSTYDMATHCRRSDGATIDVVLAAHGSVAAGSDGEVRIVDSSTGSAVATLGSIGTSSQWYSTTATISNADLGRKYDLEARSAASTLTLNGVSVYSYLA